MSVCAIVLGHDVDAVEGTQEVRRIDAPPGANRSLLLRDALAAGAASAHRWLWILEDAVPMPGALSALMEWANARPQVGLLAARVEDANGAPRFYRDWPDYGDLAAVIAGADLRALPLRSAAFHGLLLATDAVRTYGLPRVGDANWRPEWEYTGRLLRHVEGWLLPVARVRLTPDALAVDRASDLRNRLWAARSAGWSARERVDRHVQWVVAAAREPGKIDALRALRMGIRPGPT